MKKALVFSSGVVALLVVVNVTYGLVKVDTDNDYMAAMIDKHHRLDSNKSPRIILAGDSNLVFGMDSQMLENEFSVPVVNLGLHAGLGMAFMLEELKGAIDENDIALVSFAYSPRIKGKVGLIDLAVERYPEAALYRSKSTHPRLDAFLHGAKILVDESRERLKYLIVHEKVVKKPEQSPVSSIYSRQSFNEFGEIAVDSKGMPPEKLKCRGLLPHNYRRSINELNSFYEFAERKNVSVFYLFPPYAQSEFRKNEDAINMLCRSLEQDLAFEAIGDPRAFAFDDSLFFDTVYHPNAEGRRLRTRRLIENLRETPAFMASLRECLEAMGL